MSVFAWIGTAIGAYLSGVIGAHNAERHGRPPNPAALIRRNNRRNP